MLVNEYLNRVPSCVFAIYNQSVPDSDIIITSLYFNTDRIILLRIDFHFIIAIASSRPKVEILSV